MIPEINRRQFLAASATSSLQAQSRRPNIIDDIRTAALSLKRRSCGSGQELPTVYFRDHWSIMARQCPAGKTHIPLFCQAETIKRRSGPDIDPVIAEGR